MIYKKTNKISVLSWIYCLLTIVFLMLALSIIISNSCKIENWQDYATFDFEQEVSVDDNGEEVVTNLISTPEQLAGFFAMQSNDGIYAYDHTTYFTSSNSYKLKNNIDLSGKSWSPSSNSRTLDGNFYIIKNLTISNNGNYVGFVSSNSGIIKNIFFENVSITNSKTDGKGSGTGAVCGYNSGTINTVTVLSGTVKGNVYNNLNEDRRVGGICGYNAGTITHCMNYATINRGKFLGGIAGVSKKKIENCFNYGTISIPEANNYPRMGGIVGENESGASLLLCANWGSITGYYTCYSEQPTIYDIRIGGIVGHSSVAISQCGNYGEVSGGRYFYSGYKYANASYVGGIVGFIDGQVIDSCYNRGSIYSYAGKTSDSGYTTFSTSSYCQFLGTWLTINSGTRVSSSDYKGNTTYATTKYDSKYNFTVDQSYAGGIVGSSNNTVKNCYNTGSVSNSGSAVRKVYIYSKYMDWEQHLFLPDYDVYKMLICNIYEITDGATYGPICGDIGIASNRVPTIDNCYECSSTTKTGKSRSIKAYICFDSGAYITLATSWTSSSSTTENSGMTFSCDTSTYNSIQSKAKRNSGKKDTYAYNTYKGITSKNFDLDEKQTGSIVSKANINLSSGYWSKTDSSRNDGYPYIVGMYW